MKNEWSDVISSLTYGWALRNIDAFLVFFYVMFTRNKDLLDLVILQFLEIRGQKTILSFCLVPSFFNFFLLTSEVVVVRLVALCLLTQKGRFVQLLGTAY